MEQETHKPISLLDWRTLYGNVYNISLNPEMLTEKGATALARGRVKGQSIYGSSEYLVHYGRAFVVSWIVTRVLKKLKIQTKKELDALMIECWSAYKNG